MINVILAMDLNGGLGKEGVLPWNIKDELKLFKEKTLNTILIVGRKTFETLPYLKDRQIFCIARQFKTLNSNQNVSILFQSIEEAINEAEKFNKQIYIIGGSEIYDYVFKNFKDKLKVHLSIINNKYNCDRYFNLSHLENLYVSKEIKHSEFTHYEMEYQRYGEYQYINIVKDILKNGEERIGRNGKIISDFTKHLKFDLRDGFPLLTTKKMFLKGIIEELLFFIRGDTDTNILEKKGINIWKGNTCRKFLDSNGFKDRKEGEMGPMYGSIWRNFNGLSDESEKMVLKDSKKCEMRYKSYNVDGMSYIEDSVKSIDFGIDQLSYVINEINTNPTSRRILLTTYNPAQVNQGVLYPCHSVIIQFYIKDGFLDMFCYNRSSDIFLGLPFNIASSSLFLIIIAKITNLTPRYFNLTLGDAHIYENHIDSLKEQINRIPYKFPTINLPEIKNLKDIEKLTYEDFKINNYMYHPQIKAEMIA